MEDKNMMGRFYDSFGKEKDKSQELPAEIIDILNSALPDNFKYVKDESGHYTAVPRPEKTVTIKSQIEFDKEKDVEIIEKLNKIPKDKWPEYFYRTQMRVPLKNVKMGDENKVMPVEELSRDPLTDEEINLKDGFMQPYGFSKTIKLLFESPEGDKVEIELQQQAYDSLVEIKFANTEFPSLKIELYLYKPLVNDCDEEAHTNVNNKVVVTYSVTPSKADSVKDAVVALHLFRGLVNGTTKVNGYSIPSEGVNDNSDPKRIEDALKFWGVVLDLEGKLNVRFDPKAECPEEDIRFIMELQTCLIEGKSIIWRHPFDHFHVDRYRAADDGVSFFDFLSTESINHQFLEGPISATLLGAEFNIYSRTEMRDFNITNIEWDEKKESAEIYISDAPDKQGTLVRFYMTEHDVEEFQSCNS